MILVGSKLIGMIPIKYGKSSIQIFIPLHRDWISTDMLVATAHNLNTLLLHLS